MRVNENDELSELDDMMDTGRTGFQKYVPKKLVTRFQKCKPEYIAGLIMLIIVLIVVIIGLTMALIVNRTSDNGTEIKNQKSAPCEDYWIGYLGKCYYFSNESNTWRNSEKFCNSHKSSLAIIDNKEELDFLFRLRGSENHWIGIKRTYAGTGWSWTNGKSYNESLFRITRLTENTGKDEYAFLNHDGVKSHGGNFEHKWICNRK
ncbi:C-type lectin domain family 2 member A-like [Phyllobates terribilis]|uniref:C-type lectin domain family 2 member A-like n=1 Tax=Phyllobates terribilis TaxID=111132 RepID=UPI003CCA926A